MKKIIATLLLMIFATNVSAVAGEYIIIDKEGKARYEKEMDNVSGLVNTSTSTPSKNESKPKTTKADNKNQQQVQPDEKSVAQVQQQEVKINIKDIDKNDGTLLKYHQKFKKYYDIESKTISKASIVIRLKGYEKYNYPQKDNFDKNNPKILKFELQDGDYAILDTSVKSKRKYKYAAEYHKDGTLFGIVQIKTIRQTRKSATVQFVEYRDNGDEYKFKHIMFADIEKNKDKVNIAQFVYKEGVYLEDLVCAQINNDLYLNKDSKNLIVKMQKFDIPKEDNVVVEENIGSVQLVSVYLVGGAIIAPFALVGVSVLFLCIMIFGFDHH